MVESDETAVVYGMPKVALELGASAGALALPMIGPWIIKALTQGAPQQPRAAGENAPKSPPKDLRSKPISAFRVLVVDDQKSMRGLAGMSLRQLGFQRIDDAESGEEALATCRPTTTT